MKLHKLALFALAFALGPLSISSYAQADKVFEWQPANDESLRLDPANYHSGRTYHPGSAGGNIHVDIKAEKPVTIFLADANAWSYALQHPEALRHIQPMCMHEHVVDTTYTCNLPPAAVTLVIRDERNSPDSAVYAGIGAVSTGNEDIDRAIGVGIATILTGPDSPTHKYQSPNDIHIQYYRWTCIKNCIQPEFQWLEQIKEKYDLTAILKVYGGFSPDHDKTDISISIKSPVPMLVAMLPSATANQLHARPETLETALQSASCQQRAVQKLQFQCTFNVADGPQSLIVVPESTDKVPHKKAEIEVQAVKCIANCELLEQPAKPPAMAGLPEPN
jgi:hypothetical protein